MPPRAITRTIWSIIPTQPYIVINDLPKLAALKRVWPEFYRAEPSIAGQPLDLK